MMYNTYAFLNKNTIKFPIVYQNKTSFEEDSFSTTNSIIIMTVKILPSHQCASNLNSTYTFLLLILCQNLKVPLIKLATLSLFKAQKIKSYTNEQKCNNTRKNAYIIKPHQGHNFSSFYLILHKYDQRSFLS